jgi:hypothetical protein
VDGKPGAGVAEVYVRPKNGWVDAVETRQLDPKPAVTYQYLGESVAISARAVVVAAPGYYEQSSSSPSAVFEFSEPHAGWGKTADSPLRPSAQLRRTGGGRYDSFGSSIAIYGSMIAIGAPDASIDSEYESGAVYLYARPKRGWHNAKQSQKFIATNTERYDTFGSAVALAGTTIAVGAEDAIDTGVPDSDSRGEAYVFTKAKHRPRHHVEVAR